MGEKNKYTIMGLDSYDRERHISLDKAYELIQSQNDANLQLSVLENAVNSRAIKVYEFKGKKFVDRIDVGRVYHRQPEKAEGLTIERFFTRDNPDPFSVMGELTQRKLQISGKDGTVFEMDDAMFPSSWDDNDAVMVAQKYFYAPNKEAWKEKLRQKLGKDHEYTPVQLFSRVTRFLANEGERLGYFKTKEDKEAFEGELNFLQAGRKFAFNSPVYFNAGLYEAYGVEGSPARVYWKDPKTGEVVVMASGENIRPTCHACFISGPRDDLESLMNHARDECDIFSRGSGVGQDISNVRAEGEPLSCGGVASGPLSFVIIYDDEAGTIKSGGKSRRAARMTSMRGGKAEAHPDILKFIRLKVGEDKKALTLMQAGYSPGMEGEAYNTVTMQNTNLSVRLDRGFFEEIEKDGFIETRRVTDGKVVAKIPARRLLQEIAFGAWRVGDPGVQYESTIQEGHTCPNSGRINASNPCSEYMFVDNTSCNLGSYNLAEFSDEKGNFDYASFKKAVKIGSVALDIINSAASYPVEEIAAISPEFRSIGLGFANLGTLLMRKGIPYDSAEGRNYAAAITALMTGTAYEKSAEMARDLGTFTHFEINRAPMLKVVRNHKASLDEILAETIIPEKFKRELKETFDNAIRQGEEFGYRNAQTTLLAPTGTISFLMGCKTTGIEPAIRLSIKKTLAGGGSLKLKNDDIPIALKNLGYNENQIREMIPYINEYGSIIGAPHIRPEHLRVFDTSFGHKITGEGSIPFKGHIEMMGSLQKFLSGAISKTINYPTNATVKDFYDGILLGHRFGLKALAAFRDDSKPIKVLGEENDYIKFRRGEKEDLPARRNAKEFEFEFSSEHGPVPIHLIASEYPDGRPGQLVFLSYKSGSMIGALLSTAGVQASKALKRGVHLEDILEGWLDQEFEPNGLIKGHEFVKSGRSILDASAKILLLEYMNRKDLANDSNAVDETILRGYENGAFRTYEREKVDDWDFDQVIADPEYGGFAQIRGTTSKKKNGSNNSRGVTCKKCGSIMRQTKPNCYECEKCSHNIGGCTI